MSKKIVAPPRPQHSKLPMNVDEWITRPETPSSVASNGQGSEEPQVRLTFDISENLHQRIKIACARKGIKRMAVELRRILEQHFPVEQ